MYLVQLHLGALTNSQSEFMNRRIHKSSTEEMPKQKSLKDKSFMKMSQC